MSWGKLCFFLTTPFIISLALCINFSFLYYCIFLIKRSWRSYKNQQFWPGVFSRPAINRGPALINQMQFSVIFSGWFIITRPRRLGGSLSARAGRFFPSSCPWIFEDDCCTYITQSCSIVVPYILLCSIHPKVMPVFFEIFEIPIENNILFLVSPNSAVQCKKSHILATGPCYLYRK